MRNDSLDEAQTRIKIARRNTNNLRYADDITLMAESEEELKSLLVKVKEEWKSWLKAQHSENEDHGIWSCHFMGNRWKNSGKSDIILGGSKINGDGDCSHEIKRLLLLGRKAMTQLNIKKQRHYFANKGPSSQIYGFSNSHVWMWELDYEESWVLKNWCFRTVIVEKTLESPLNFKEIQPVNHKGNQSWIFIRRVDDDWSSNTLATWCKELTHWKRLWCWERLKAGGEGDDRGWNG